MTPHDVLRTMLRGEVAGRGDLYSLDQCPYTPDSRKAKLWSAGFAAGRLERIDDETSRRGRVLDASV